MKGQFLILLIFVSFISCGQTSQILKVKLIDYTPDKIPAFCGVIAWATTLKFEIISENANFKKGQQILVIFCCPREMGDTMFVNKQDYLITTCGSSKEDKELTEYDWTIFYKYEKESLQRFWNKSLEKLK